MLKYLDIYLTGTDVRYFEPGLDLYFQISSINILHSPAGSAPYATTYERTGRGMNRAAK